MIAGDSPVTPVCRDALTLCPCLGSRARIPRSRNQVRPVGQPRAVFGYTLGAPQFDPQFQTHFPPVFEQKPIPPELVPGKHGDMLRVAPANGVQVPETGLAISGCRLLRVLVGNTEGP